MGKKNTTIQVRTSEQIKQLLEEIARQDRRSVTGQVEEFVVIEALKRGLIKDRAEVNGKHEDD